MIVHDATPSMPSPIVITLVTNRLINVEYTSLGCAPETVWDWLRTTPVWPRLIEAAGVQDVEFADLECVGHATGWTGGNECLAIGLPVMVRFDVPDHFDKRRQSWTIRRTLVAVNEDGTRGAVVTSELLQGADEAREIAAESIAYREGGGLPDVD